MTIQDDVHGLIATMEVVAGARLQSGNANETFEDAERRLKAVSPDHMPESLGSALEMIQGARNLAEQAHGLATEAIGKIEEYISTLQN